MTCLLAATLVAAAISGVDARRALSGVSRRLELLESRMSVMESLGEKRFSWGRDRTPPERQTGQAEGAQQ